MWSWLDTSGRRCQGDGQGSRQVLRGSTGFYEVLRGSTRFYRVLHSSTRFGQNPGERNWVDIRSREHDGGGLTSNGGPFLQKRCERRRTGAFDDVVRVAEQRAHRIFDFVIGDFEHVIRAGPDDRERIGIGRAARQAVCDSGAHLVRYRPAKRKRPSVGWCGGRDHTNNPRLQVQCVASRNGAANSRAQSDRHV